MYPNQMNPQQQQGGFGFDVQQYEAQAPMENLPPAWYNVLIVESELEALQSGKGTACKNVYEVYGGAYSGRKIFDNLNIIHESQEAQDIARRQLRTIADSIGKQQVQGPWDLINNYMCVKVGLSRPKRDATEEEKAAHEARNQVKGYKPFDQALHQQNQQPAAQTYNVAVQPQGPAMGNGMPNYAPQLPQQQPMQQMPPQMAPQQMQQQMPPQMQPQQQAMPQQQQMQQPPMQQQFAQPQQPAPMPNNGPQPGSVPGSQPAPMNGQPDQANYAQAATAPAGQPSPAQAAPNAGQQPAPPSTFAPQNGMPPQQPGQPPQQQPQQPQPQMAQPQQQMAQPQQMPQQPGQQPNGIPQPPSW